MTKYISVIFVLFVISSCDIEYPDEWQSPNWELPLTIPLIDQIYSVSDISGGNQIKIDSSSQTFIIEVDTTLLDSGFIQIEESFFIIPKTDPVSEDVSFNISSEGIETPTDFDIPAITLESLVPEDIGNCLPYVFLDSYDETIILDEISITEGLDDFSEYEGLEISIDYVRIKNGQLSLEVDNQFPFDIAELEISFDDQDGDNWETLIVENVSAGTQATDSVNLMTGYDDGRALPSATTPQNTIQVQDDGDLAPGECQFNDFPSSVTNPIVTITIVEINDQFICETAGHDWIAGECIAQMTEVLCLDLSPGDVPGLETGVDGVSIEDINVLWGTLNNEAGSDECWLYLPGWDLTAQSNELLIDVSFDSIELQDLVGDIAYETESTTSQSIAINESISLISAHIEDINHSDTNKIKINVTNDLFTDVDIELSIENILNDFGQPLTHQTTVGTGFFNTLNDEVDLSNYDIRSPDVGPFEELIINNKISFDSEDIAIEFDKDYSLSVDSIYTETIKFDELYVDLQNFESDDIDMASVPAGFGDIGLPTLRFNLYIYNEIDAPLTLNLDLMGITEEDTVKIHIEPALKFPDGYEGIDSTTISIYSDTLEVQGKTFTDYYELEAPIDTLFSRDEIKVTGNATLNGESSLKPGKSFWGDVGIELRPLTIVFPDNVTFSPQDKTELELDQSTRENIDDGLITAELFIEVGNSMPMGATLNMLVSDSTFFPLCFDTLNTGAQASQTVSDTCWTLIEDNYAPDFIYVNKKENGEVISAEFMNITDLDTILTDTITNLDTTATAFIGRLLALDLGIPTNLDENGFILEKDITYNNLLLDTTKMNWLTSNDKLYISPIINNVRTSIDTLPGYVTLHTIDYLQIRSFLTLIMDSKIVTGDDSEE